MTKDQRAQRAQVIQAAAADMREKIAVRFEEGAAAIHALRHASPFHSVSHDALSTYAANLSGWAREIRYIPLPAPAAFSDAERVGEIVAWLRQQSDLGATMGNEADKDTTKRYAFGGGSLALARAADMIESGEFRDASPASLNQPAASVVEEGVERLFEDVPEDWAAQGYRSKFEEIADMANVGRSLMERIAEVATCEGAMFGWAPADDPAEVVIDMANKLDAALSAAPSTPVGEG